MTVAGPTRFAAELLGALIGNGITDVVICPGARSQALALTAAALADSGELRVHVRIDERSAAFLALGLAVESGVPAPIITTSGSAVANLLPAVVEAHHAGVPMMLLTADRPAALRGTGANQVTIQPGMFGEFVSWESDVAVADVIAEGGASLAPVALLATTAREHARTGPVHLNLQFVEPLSSPVDDDVLEAARTAMKHVREARHAAGGGDAPIERDVVTVARGPRTVVIAGAGAGEHAEDLAHEAMWPLIAEVSSGARYGRNVIVNYREVLGDVELASEIERVIVFGHPTLSRQVPALLDRADVDVVRVPLGRAVGVSEEAALADTGTADAAAQDVVWLRTWQRIDREFSETRAAKLAELSAAVRAPNIETARSTKPDDQRAFVQGELAASRAEVTRELLVDAVWRATWPHDRLVFGASRLIRVADATVPGKKISVHANRGLSGIDGNIGTGIGIALAAAPALTRIVLGDVAALHDAGSMLFPNGEERPRVQVIVGNDGGGSIFDLLEVASSADATTFDRVMFTGHNASFEDLSRAYGWRFVRVTSMGELERALTAAGDGPELVEVVLAR
jgi:2-succinyl-5-enolpyruvyl-6-hydroxy-3-cyclohexene-1-carboxylate synthase